MILLCLLFGVVWNVNIMIMTLFSLRVTWPKYINCCCCWIFSTVSFLRFRIYFFRLRSTSPQSLMKICLYQGLQSIKTILTIELRDHLYTAYILDIHERVWRYVWYLSESLDLTFKNMIRVFRVMFWFWYQYGIIPESGLKTFEWKY